LVVVQAENLAVIREVLEAMAEEDLVMEKAAENIDTRPYYGHCR
jgi:hypothetical protein